MSFPGFPGEWTPHFSITNKSVTKSKHSINRPVPDRLRHRTDQRTHRRRRLSTEYSVVQCQDTCTLLPGTACGAGRPASISNHRSL